MSPNKPERSTFLTWTSPARRTSITSTNKDKTSMKKGATRMMMHGGDGEGWARAEKARKELHTLNLGARLVISISMLQLVVCSNLIEEA